MTKSTLVLAAVMAAICGTSGHCAGQGKSDTSTDWRAATRTMVTDIADSIPAQGDWFVVGPFDHKQFDAPFAPEMDPAKPVSTSTVYRGRGGVELRWQKVNISGGKPFDLRTLCPKRQKDGTFYLTRTITARRSRTFAVAMRGMSGLALWTGGKQIVDRGPGDGWLGGGWAPKEAVLLPLAAGKNRLLMKVEGLHKYATWHFVYGRPGEGAVRYTLTDHLVRRHPAAAAGLDALRQNGVDVLKVWPVEKRTAATTKQLTQAAHNVVSRGNAWLTMLRAADVPPSELASASTVLKRIAAELAAARPVTSARLTDVYFEADAACRRLQNARQALVIQNWLHLDRLAVHSPMNKTVLDRAEAALSRGEALLKDYGKQLSGSDAASEKLAQIRRALQEQTRSPNPEAIRRLYLKARRQVRELALKNPALHFKELVFYKRFTPRTMNIHRHQFPSSRYSDGPARPGGDLYVLGDLASGGKLRPLLRGRLGRGMVRGYDLSYDGKRIVFGFWNADVKRPAPKTRFEYDCYVTEGHADIFELDLATDKIRQLTNEPWHDIDPCYLPSGRIAFASERCGYNAQCDPHPWSEAMVNLYTMNGDGGDVRRFVSNKDSDNFARVLNDGRVVYTHWEYHERHWLNTQSLWVSRPDGSGQDALFKQHLNLPLSLEESRSIPRSNKLVAVATGHHTNAAGAIVRINLRRGIKPREAIEIVTPGASRFEGGLNGVPVSEGGVGGSGLYTTPWALSEKYFLASYNPTNNMTRARGYGLCLIDVFGNRELIYRDPDISCFSPVPLASRRVPPVLPDATDPTKKDATLVVTDVEQGLKVPRGTIKYLRINESMPWPYSKKGAGRYTVEHDWTIKRTIGIVPVEKDGSAHFTVPADVGVYFQALDEQFREVRRMRSLVSFQPGEKRSCTGCHETQNDAPPSSTVLAMTRPARKPEAPAWGSDRPISFMRDVQPVLDAHCTRCHSGEKPDGGVNLLPGLTGRAHPTAHSSSYDALSKYVPRANFHGKFEVSQPYQFGSAKSKLVDLLLAGHHKVKLNRDEWLALLTWIDTNGLYLGSFISVHDWGRWGYRPQTADMQAVKAVQQRRCNACHDKLVRGPVNLAAKAKVFATSEFSGAFAARMALEPSSEWAVNGQQAKDQAEFTLQWDNPVEVEQIVYAGRTTALIECWKDYEVYLDKDATPAAKGTLKNVHGPQRIAIRKRRARKVRLKFLNSHTPNFNPGASGIGVYSSVPSDKQLARFPQSTRQGGLAQPGWIHPRDPRKSLYLLAPLAKEAGGWGKCTPAVFKNTKDADYQALLAETRKIWQRMRKDPTPAMKELIRDEQQRRTARK